ncbi:hypothetical protein PENTCL1PPCAC_19657, partial [Pristionchus entomophagus]
QLGHQTVQIDVLRDLRVLLSLGEAGPIQHQQCPHLSLHGVHSVGRRVEILLEVRAIPLYQYRLIAIQRCRPSQLGLEHDAPDPRGIRVVEAGWQ